VIPEFLDRNCLVYQRDGIEFINMLHAESVQLIWTDPPAARDQFTTHKNYTLMEYIELCAAMADAAFRVLTPSGVLAISLPRANVEGVVEAIGKGTHFKFGGYTYDSLDLYSTIVAFDKGDPKWNASAVAVVQVTPLSMISEFVEAHTDPGDLVVDPFCGSGAVLEAAVKADRWAIVNDHDPDAVAATIRRYKETCA